MAFLTVGVIGREFECRKWADSGESAKTADFILRLFEFLRCFLSFHPELVETVESQRHRISHSADAAEENTGEAEDFLAGPNPLPDRQNESGAEETERLMKVRRNHGFT